MTDSSSYIGRPLKRVEDQRLIAGQGHYVDDMKLPGQAHLVFVRSPYAHARISSLNVEAAKKAPGVVAVVTAKELGQLRPPPPAAMLPGLKVSPHPYLAEDVVHLIGMPIVAVVAETGAMARDAADLVEVEYEPLPVVTDAEAALRPDAPLLHAELGSNQAVAHVTKGGDVATAFASAAHTVKVRVVHNRLIGVPIEPRGILAQYDRGMDELTLWMTTQGPSRLRAALAVVLGFPETKIRVIAPEVGGGFGTKSGVYREDAIAAAIALQIGRPVKWCATRSEEFLALTHGRAAVTEAEAAVTQDGRVTGLKAKIIYNLGAHFNGRSLLPMGRHTAMITGAYRIEHAEVQGIGAYTNTGLTAPYRGAGRPEAAFTIERLMDEVGRTLGLDPVEIRRRNFIPSVAFPFKTGIGTVYDSGDYEGALNKLLELADYPALRREQAEARKRGELMGIGLATFVEPSGGLAWESGLVRVEQTGKVTVVTGSSAHGQGHETTFAQIVADHLGVPFEEITVRHGDTLGVPRGIGTVGSRSTALGGSALVQASIEVREKGRRLAASLLEASVEDIESALGGFYVKGSADRRVSWTRVAEFAYLGMRLPKGETPGLEATAFYNQEREMHGFGAVLAVVRIDNETGTIRLQRFFSVDDCGNVINPLLARGQLEGGLVQGIGQALLEHVIYNEDGQLLTGSFMDYCMPRADDIPHFIAESTVTPTPLNPLGAKGTGETGTVAAPPAIVNAVVDALAPFGVRHLDMPLTSEKIWRALHGA